MNFHAIIRMFTAVFLAAFFITASFPPELEAYYCISDDVSVNNYIKWVDFNVSYEAMAQALKYDIDSYGKEIKIDWCVLLAYAATKNGGNFSDKKNTYIDKAAKLLKEGTPVEELASESKYFSYYHEAYSAVLSGFVGEYYIDDGNDRLIKKYGLKAFSPIASGYWFSHYDDFGNSRSYGFRRSHLGNDLMTNVGTPIIAVEGGTIEEFGWNQYGGWRIGIRSHDKKRYYYYAHMRKGHPFNYSLDIGQTVTAGEVIGYVGMTGYSSKEDVNGMTKPHLHFGIQLIFDEIQKDALAQIWIDVYDIVRLLQKNRSPVYYDGDTKDFYTSSKIHIA